MRQYEVNFIVDPVLSGDEIKSTAKTYEDMLVKEGGSIIHVDEMGLKQLAYSINKRSSGIYYCVEFSIENGEIIPKLELALRRDERIMRYLTVRLDRYGVKYNEDKRKGLIGKVTKAKEEKKDSNNRDRKPAAPVKAAPVKAAPVKAAPVKAEATPPPAAPAPAPTSSNTEEE